ncbi:MAG: hypothetical protein Q8P82_00820 [bacterium]|nr:hypothetical protein [bacterium]
MIVLMALIILGVFGSCTFIAVRVIDYKKARALHAPAREELQQLTRVNEELRGRVEVLESIVCDPAFDTNKQFRQLVESETPRQLPAKRKPVKKEEE